MLSQVTEAEVAHARLLECHGAFQQSGVADHHTQMFASPPLLTSILTGFSKRWPMRASITLRDRAASAAPRVRAVAAIRFLACGADLPAGAAIDDRYLPTVGRYPAACRPVFPLGTPIGTGRAAAYRALIQVLQAYRLLLALPARRRTRVEERWVDQAGRGRLRLTWWRDLSVNPNLRRSHPTLPVASIRRCFAN